MRSREIDLVSILIQMGLEGIVVFLNGLKVSNIWVFIAIQGGNGRTIYVRTDIEHLFSFRINS